MDASLLRGSPVNRALASMVATPRHLDYRLSLGGAPSLRDLQIQGQASGASETALLIGAGVLGLAAAVYFGGRLKHRIGR